MTTIDKIVFSQNAPAKNTLWARPSEKGTELLIFNKGKWGTVGADDFQRFHYEVYSSLEDITEPKPNALYLIGPKGEGEDKYDEYVYTEEGFTKIGDTSIDMSDVIKYIKNGDWNENDSTSLSYIKNRTHYEETSERILYTGNKAPIYEENNSIFFDIPLDSLMQPGEEIEMKITPRGADSPTVLRGIAGDEGMVSLKTSYPSGPSAGLYNEYIHGALDFNLYLSGINIPQDANFEIKAVNTTVHVLDEKFIPATIARTADVDLGVLKTGGVSYNTGTNQFGYGGTSGGGNVNKINLNSGYITGLTGIYSMFGTPITISGNVTGIENMTLNSGTISGVSQIDMSGGTISEVAQLIFKSGGTLTPSINRVQDIFGKNKVHISMSGSTLSDGIDFGNAPLKNINGIAMSTSSGIISGTLQGTIKSTTFSSGNTFTTGFIDELKTALGIS